jgi:hypothetical protein
MQRLYSMFPVGAPGVGLVLLRGSLAISLWALRHDVMRWLPLGAQVWCAGLMSGALLMGGLTPIATALTLLLVCLMQWGPEVPSFQTLSMALLAAATLLLGPGAYSLDARLYGHRVLSFHNNKNN